jgi:hypothetical protein
MKKKTTKRRSLRGRVKRLLDFPEPPPQMDVSDPRWADAFARWAQRKAEWYGLEDAIEMFGRALGIKPKTMDAYAERQREERRKKQKRLEDMAASSNAIYGKPLNSV